MQEEFNRKFLAGVRGSCAQSHLDIISEKLRGRVAPEAFHYTMGSAK
jgi:hypothetical protein